MEVKNMVKTGVRRKFLVWFFAISVTILTFLSGVLEIKESIYDSYIFLCFSVITGVLFTKVSDNFNKFKIAKIDKGVKND